MAVATISLLDDGRRRAVPGGQLRSGRGLQTVGQGNKSASVREPGAMDGVSIDPHHHRVLFENEFVRVVESIVRVGETTALHTHLTPRVMYALSGSTYIRRSPDGTVIEDSGFPDGSVEHPKVMWSGPTELHTIENTGSEDLVVIAIEILGVGRETPDR